MSTMRNAVLGRLLDHLAIMEHDMMELHVISRNWAQGSKSQALIRQAEKDFQMYHARMKALFSEMEHMDVRHRQFTGEATKSVVAPNALRTTAQIPLPPPAALRHPDDQHAAPAEHLPHPGEEFATVDDEAPIAPPPVANAAEPPPPATVSGDAHRRLAEMAKDLPPHILKELQKAGLQ